MARFCLRKNDQTKLIIAITTQKPDKEKVEQLRTLLIELENGDKKQAIKVIKKADF